MQSPARSATSLCGDRDFRATRCCLAAGSTALIAFGFVGPFVLEGACGVAAGYSAIPISIIQGVIYGLLNYAGVTIRPRDRRRPAIPSGVCLACFSSSLDCIAGMCGNGGGVALGVASVPCFLAYITPSLLHICVGAPHLGESGLTVPLLGSAAPVQQSMAPLMPISDWRPQPGVAYYNPAHPGTVMILSVDFPLDPASEAQPKGPR